MKKSSSRGASVRSIISLLSIVVVPVALWSTACGQQREGERCDHRNGNDDCNTGLICKQSKDLGGNADICCPPGTSQNPECIPGGGSTSTATGTSTGTDMSTSTSTDASSSASTSTSTSTATSSSATGTGGSGSSSSATGTGAGGGSGS